MMADVKRFMFLLIDTVGLLVDRTRVVAGFNHTPTYQARGREVRQGREAVLYSAGMFYWGFDPVLHPVC